MSLATDPDAADRVCIALLGGVRVRVEGGGTGEETDVGGRRKVAALLALVALRPRQIHAREAVAGTLWPDASSEEGRHSLRQTLSLLRQQLGGAPWLIADAQTLRLAPHVTTDAV